MEKIKKGTPLGFWEKYLLRHNGKKDGKRNGFINMGDDWFISDFMKYEINQFSLYCRNVQSVILPLLTQYSKFILVAIDDIDQKDADIEHRRSEILARKTHIEDRDDKQHEMTDLEARTRQLDIAENTMKTEIRNSCRTHILGLEECIRNYDADIALKLDRYRLIIDYYYSYARKYKKELPVFNQNLIMLCDKLGLTDLLAKERQMLSRIKSKLNFNNEDGETHE